MFCYSKLSHSKIAHTENCYIAKKFKPETTGLFINLSSVYSCGYRFCKHCNTIEKQLLKEEDTLLDYCRRYGISYEYNGRVLKITSTISKWLIALEPSGKTRLYHRNKRETSNKAPGSFPGYHDQKTSCSTLTEYLEYIVDHDGYRHRHPLQANNKKRKAKYPARKGSKQWKKDQQKIHSRERRKKIRIVLDTIESLDSNYKVTDTVGTNC